MDMFTTNVEVEAKPANGKDQIVALLREIISRLDNIDERLDTVDERLSNLSIPYGDGYSVES